MRKVYVKIQGPTVDKERKWGYFPEDKRHSGLQGRVLKCLRFSDKRKYLPCDSREQNPNPWNGTWSAENSNFLLPENYAHKWTNEYTNKWMSEWAKKWIKLSQKEMASSPLPQWLKDWKIIHHRWQKAEPHDAAPSDDCWTQPWNLKQPPGSLWPDLPSWHGPVPLLLCLCFLWVSPSS